MPPEPDPIRPSLMSLLTDEEPRRSSESQLPGTKPSELVEALVRDLRHLLNTRVRCVHWEDRSKSGEAPWDYGLPDFSGADADGIGRNALVARWIVDAIRQYEPRLTRVTVTPATSPSGSTRRLVFRIEAKMTTEPYQNLVFSSRLESSTGRFGVDESHD